ncbi:MAG: RNA methyltransferase [Acidobacteriota bacterium]
MSDRVITSSSNSRLKHLRRSMQEGRLDSLGRLPVEGRKLVGEAIRSGRVIDEVYICREKRHLPWIQDLIRDLSGRNVTVLEVTEKALTTVSDTEAPQGVLALVRIPAYDLEETLRNNPLVVVVDRLQDPGNLGTLIRSCEAFGVGSVLLTRNTVNPANQKCVRASAGSLFRVPLVSDLRSSELVRVLKKHRFRVLATSPSGLKDFRQVSYSGATAIVVGSEGSGLDEGFLKEASTTIRIPLGPSVESLNVAVATSILLCEAARQRSS